MFPVEQPYKVYTDLNGQPLNNGYVYFGVANQNPITSPVTVYWDAAGTQPATQPLRTTNGYIVRAGTPANVFFDGAYSELIKSSQGVQVFYARNSDEFSVTGAINDFLADIALSNGADLIGYLPIGTGTVLTTVQKELDRQTVSVFRYMTTAQITAVQSYAFTLDVTTAVQAAIDSAWTLKADLFVPSGGYLVTGLTLPGTYPTLDQRDRALRFYGQGYGNPFSTLNSAGTVFKSVTDAAILSDRALAAPNAHGTYEIDHIRFDGTSTTPVVLINGLYGTSSIHNCVFYQRGVGDGLKVIYSATSHIYENYSINRDFVTAVLGVARVGIGFNFPLSYDSGLTTFSKNSSRGWLTGYMIGGGAGAPYSTMIDNCEASTVYNGAILAANTNKAVIDTMYLEGGDGGIGIQNLGSYNTIENCITYPGFMTGIEDTSTSNFGSVIENNTVSLGDVVNSIGINVASSAAFGGNAKNVTQNSVVYTAGTAGVNGIRINGTDPRLNCFGNAFNPRAAWTGAGTLKINDLSTNGVYGLVGKETGDIEIITMSRGGYTLHQGASALTQADVAANILTIPDAGNYFIVSATGAATVTKIAAGVTNGRPVTFRTTTANMSFTDSAFIETAAGAVFTGPGMIEFMIERVGADNYAYELGRTVF